MSKWQREKFAVSRDLFYASDESLCQALERAVWVRLSSSLYIFSNSYTNLIRFSCLFLQYEAEKFLHAGAMLETYVAHHLSWLAENEQDLSQLLARMTQDRCTRELRATQGLVDQIHHAIEEATSLGDLWLVTSDAHPTVQAETVWKQFSVPLLAANEPELLEAFETPGGLQHLQKQRQASLQKLRSSSMRLSFAQQFIGTNGGANGRKKSRSMSLRGSMSGGFNRRSGDGAAAAAIGNSSSSTAGAEEALFVALHVQRASIFQPQQQQVNPADVLQQRYQERYEKERQQLLSALAEVRQAREQEYLDIGFTPAAAKLAAFNELLLEEQHQQADLQAKYAVYFTKSEDASAGAPQVELRLQSRHPIAPAEEEGEEASNNQAAENALAEEEY